MNSKKIVLEENLVIQKPCTRARPLWETDIIHRWILSMNYDYLYSIKSLRSLPWKKRVSTGRRLVVYSISSTSVPRSEPWSLVGEPGLGEFSMDLQCHILHSIMAATAIRLLEKITTLTNMAVIPEKPRSGFDVTNAETKNFAHFTVCSFHQLWTVTKYTLEEFFGSHRYLHNWFIEILYYFSLNPWPLWF